MVGARPDRADDLVGLGRGEDELHVLGRLLDELEQGVEALRRDHVRLVDDVDLVAATTPAPKNARSRRSRASSTPPWRGRVDLDDVDRAGAAAGQRDAGVADAARDVGRALLAVEAAGQDAGARGLAAAARAGEEVGVVDPVRAQGLQQRLGDVLLADDLGEGLWPVAAVEGGGHVPDPNR